MIRILFTFFVVLALAAPVHAYIESRVPVVVGIYPSDEELYTLALEHGLVTEGMSEDDVVPEGRGGYIAWILVPNEYKVRLLTEINAMFAEDGIAIRGEAASYVDEINQRLFNLIEEGKTDYFDQISFTMMYATLAVSKADFDNGEDPLLLIEQYMGPEGVENFKMVYPEKYRELTETKR